MQRLNDNQIQHRAGQVGNVVGGLHPDDMLRVFEIVAGRNGQATPADQRPDSDSIPDKLLKAIIAGLDSGNAQMARVAMDWQTEQAGKEHLKELTVNITPYTIQDASLAKIVGEASEGIVGEIEQAIAKRRGAK